MLKHALVVALLAALAINTPGCTRMARSAMRNRTSNSYYSSRQVNPEEVKIDFTDLDAPSVKLLNGHRAKWSEFVQKYDATELPAREQVIAVLDGYNAAHWSEKPQIESLLEPLGVAIGDALKAEGSVTWVLAEGEAVCLVDPAGKVAVGPVGIASTWIDGRKHPMDALIKDVAKAVRETKGYPKLIGFDEEPQGDPHLR